MDFSEFLLEMHWEDIFSGEFKQFRKDWGKISRESNQYYVQFTNFKTDTIDKTTHNDPDHHDPAANYAYPLKYVIEHPADIWYGRSAKFLRVLKNQAKNPLRINHVTEYQATSYLYRMGIPQHHLKVARKHFKFKGSSAIPKAFFAAIQHDMSKEGYPIRSPQEQTKLIMKAGFDAIIDESRNQNSAIINAREPQQIAFLNRGAFEVVKVYRLGQTQDHSLVWISPDKVQKRKLASMLLAALDDKIIKGPEDGYFWSAKGRRIFVDFPYRKSIHDRKMGEKKHKEFKKSDHYGVDIIIDHSEKGTIEGHYVTDEKFKDIVDSMLFKWRHRPDIEFQPDTIDAYQARRKAQQDAYYQKLADEKHAENSKREKELIPTLQELAPYFNLNFQPNPNRRYNYWAIIEAIVRNIRHGKDVNAYWDESAKNFLALKEDGFEDMELFSFGYFPADLSHYPDLIQLKEIVTAVSKIHNIDWPYIFNYTLRQLKAKNA